MIITISIPSQFIRYGLLIMVTLIVGLLLLKSVFEMCNQYELNHGNCNDIVESNGYAAMMLTLFSVILTVFALVDCALNLPAVL